MPAISDVVRDYDAVIASVERLRKVFSPAARDVAAKRGQSHFYPMGRDRYHVPETPDARGRLTRAATAPKVMPWTATEKTQTA
jgi:hypothetical protein